MAEAGDWFGRIGVGVERLSIAAGLTRVPAMAHHRLGIHVGRAVNASCRCDGRRHVRVQADGDIDIVPAGLDGEWEDDADCSILRVSVAPSLIAGTAEELGLDPRRAGLMPRFQHRDAGLAHIAFALEAHTAAAGAADLLSAESLARALAIRLIGEAGAAALPRGQGLSPRQRRALAEVIEAELDGDLSLTRLAAVAGISASHLKVLFRRSFGLPVHQYVIQRRIERARLMLLDGQMPISQVALAAGFAHQSHMAHAMRRVLGMTPAALTRGRLPS